MVHRNDFYEFRHREGQGIEVGNWGLENLELEPR
jgi:hypothetical protein